MIRKRLLWFAPLALVSLVATGPASLEAAAGQSTKKAGAAKPAAKRTPQRSTRRPTAAQVRAAATAREIAEATVPRYKVDASGELVPDLRAAAAIIYDPDTNQVLWEENSQTQRSIASITKVMTAVVMFETDPDMSRVVPIVRSDVSRASTTFLRQGDKVTVEDLLHLLLIASDNAAARALARTSPYGAVGFIDRMNQKAADLGLESTHYADPSGLLSENVSSAFDMARLITFASNEERISAIMRKHDHTFRAGKRTVTFRSTNKLLDREEFDVMAGKTGFISKAGYCLATLLRLPGSQQQVAVVVLGARSNAGRFLETQNLFNWLSAKASTIFATKTVGTGAAATRE